VNVEIYADETGTHDVTGKLGGSAVAGIAGYMAWPDDWAKLSSEWQKVLNEFKIKEFHYSQFVRRKERTTKPDWPYYGWTDAQANEFEHKLAALAGQYPQFGFAALGTTGASNSVRGRSRRQTAAANSLGRFVFLATLRPEVNGFEGGKDSRG